MYNDIIASHSDERMVSKIITTYPLFWPTQQYEKWGKARADISVSPGLQQVLKLLKKDRVWKYGARH